VGSLNLTHLRAFHWVAVEGSFVAAAGRLRVSQPTLSEQVKAIERGYGVLLFDRRGRRLELTSLGRRLYEISQRLFDTVEEAQRCVAEARQLHVSQLRVGADSPVYAMPLLAAMREHLPGVRTTLTTGSTARVLADLLERHVDVAYLGNLEPDPQLVSWPLWRTRLVAVVGTTHPWADRQQVDAAELAHTRLVLREPGATTRRVLDEAFAATRLPITDALEVDTRDGVLMAVAAGLGVGLVAEDELTAATRLTRLGINGLTLDLTEYLVCRTERRDLTVVRAACDLARALA
jgi:LysR family transcriptional regulator, low CO2-responsive transcriptional regulator